MQLSFIPLFLLSAAPTVFACEGECIVGITNAFINNYTSPVYTALTMATDKIEQLLQIHPHNSGFMTYFSPLVDAYHNQSYSSMENAIFPSYFHGKCQQNGVEPPGCPNPDCPVVCGTPGSLVHYYSQLRDIAFKCTQTTLAALANPGSTTYKDVERRVLAAASRPSARGLRMYSRALSRYPLDDLPPSKRSETASHLAEIMKQIPKLLAKACGGSELSECSWETPMKSFILSFP